MKLTRLGTLILIAAVGVTSAAQVRRRIVRRESPPAAEDVAHYRGGPARTGIYATNGPQPGATPLWRVQTADASFSAPVYASGALYVTDGTGRELSIDAQTGSTRWRTQFLSSIVSAATITRDAVYVGVDTHAVLALSISDGRLLGRYDVDSEVFASPLIDGDTLYVATESGALYAFELPSRRQKWRYSGVGPAHGHPAASRGTVYYASGGALIAVDSNGSERWKVTSSVPFFSPSLGVSNGVVYGSGDNVVYAFDAQTGAERWRYTAPSAATGFSAPVIWNGLIIFGTIAPASLIALNGSSGTIAWQIPLPAFIEPIMAGAILYGGSADFGPSADPNAQQKVYSFDPLSGQPLWSADVTGQVATGAAVGDGKLFLQTQARNLYAFH